MSSPPRHVGPPLVPLAVIAFGLFIASLIVGAAGGASFPSPYDSADHVLRVFADHGTTVRAAATLQFASAVPLAILAASLSSRMRFLGFAHVPGALIASTGGILASSMLMLSGLVQWVLSQPGVSQDPGVVRALADLAFATGGPGHVVFLGLLIAGLAVPAAIGHVLPRGLWIAGLALALVAELSTLALPFQDAAFLLPVARFGGLIWLIATAALLPARRPTSLTTPTKDTHHVH